VLSWTFLLAILTNDADQIHSLTLGIHLFSVNVATSNFSYLSIIKVYSSIGHPSFRHVRLFGLLKISIRHLTVGDYAEAVVEGVEEGLRRFNSGGHHDNGCYDDVDSAGDVGYGLG